MRLLFQALNILCFSYVGPVPCIRSSIGLLTLFDTLQVYTVLLTLRLVVLKTKSRSCVFASVRMTSPVALSHSISSLCLPSPAEHLMEVGAPRSTPVGKLITDSVYKTKKNCSVKSQI